MVPALGAIAHSPGYILPWTMLARIRMDRICSVMRHCMLVISGPDAMSSQRELAEEQKVPAAHFN